MPYISEVAGEYVDDEGFDDDEGECLECYGRGFITDCPDDLCQGEDGCIHGDGDRLCPNGCDPY